MPNPKLETYKNKATGTVYDYTDAAAQASIAAIEEKIPDVASSENQLVTEAGLNNVLNFKEDKVPGKGLSTNDYDNTEKAKVAGAFPRSEQAVLGAKNLWPITLSELKTINTSGVWSGSTYTHPYGTSFVCTVDDAGYVTDIEANGAPSGGDSDLYLYVGMPSWLTANTDYILSGCPSGGGENTYRIQYSNWTEGATYIKYDNGDGVTIQKITDSTTQRARIMIKSGYAISGKHFKPMLRLATDTDPTYAPYAMTNKELTNAVAVKNDATQITSDNMTIEYCIIAKAGKIRACTIKATANANITAMATIFKGFPDALLEAIDCQTSAEFVNASDNSLYPVIGRSVSGNFEVSTKNAIASGVTIRGTIIYVAK